MQRDEYPDQVPRRLAYEAAHPGVTITEAGSYWRAVLPGGRVVVRVTLADLLDALEAPGGPRPDG